MTTDYSAPAPFTSRTGTPFLWPTWIAPLIAGDKHCEWSAWLKAHYKYAKRPQDNENSLAMWKAQHADMVSRRHAQLVADGWDVTVEGQNKFSVKGKAAVLGGAPDLVATRLGVLRIEDCKTGQERDGDFWQVCVYLLAAPLARPELAALEPTGAVVYPGRTREIDQSTFWLAEARIASYITKIGTGPEPVRTPSASECAWCDIAACPERVMDGAGETETDIF